MRIVKLQAENLKRLRAVEITPDGNTVVIAGRNGQGKTSVLDAIWLALGGGPAAKGTTRPIRDGALSATVTLDLGELKVTRSWTRERTTLLVENADGARYSSPQSMLDKLVGRLSFDPLAFAQQDSRTQIATLLELVELPFDPAELDARRRALFDDRTDVGREVRRLTGALEQMPESPAGVPTEETSSSYLLGCISDARHAESVRRQLNMAIERETQQIANLEREIEAARARRVESEQQLSVLAEPVDVAQLEQQLADVEETNRQVRDAARRRDIAEQLAAAENQHTELTVAIEKLDEDKAAAVAAAKMPIDGLGFDDNGVTYRRVPFKQCSSAEQLRVSVAMAMALNPKLRVIRITDASLLDSENLRLIEELATEQDFQVWLEVVDESGQMGVVIEDGRVAGTADTDEPDAA